MREVNIYWKTKFNFDYQTYHPVQTELEVYELDFPVKCWTGCQTTPRHLDWEESAAKAVRVAKIISSCNVLEVMVCSERQRSDTYRYYPRKGPGRYFMYVGAGSLAEYFASRPVLPSTDEYIRLGVGKWGI